MIAASHDIEIHTPCNSNALLEFAQVAVSTLHEDLGITRICSMPPFDLVLDQGARFVGPSKLILIAPESEVQSLVGFTDIWKMTINEGSGINHRIWIGHFSWSL